ncbi:MAG: RNA-protein complex protein Nop10 [Candidatus Heimdallarchaeota archaeon]
MKLLRKCSVCGRYTLSESDCPECGGETRSAHPARYSPEDKWGKYRRKLHQKNMKFEPLDD